MLTSLCERSITGMRIMILIRWW